MSIILDKFRQAKIQFDQSVSQDEGNKIMNKIAAIINELGINFNTLDGNSLAEIQMKLAGYKFYMAEYLAELQQISESLKMEIKEITAKRWDEVSENIRAEKGKVSNKQQIENILIMETRELSSQQILYETRYYMFKLRLSSLDDVLTCIVQRLAELKRQIDQSKM